MSVLYIVSTPIGNLEDITLRAIRTLKEVDLIAAEDTRHTKKLLTHFDIHNKDMVSFHQANERGAVDKVINILKDGRSVALVSDAGTPSISDPGFRLVRGAIEAGIKVEAIPGPSAAIMALSLSGLPTDQFTFVGFLPDKDGKRRTKLGTLKDYDHTLIFYISKWKLEKTLKDMLEVFGDRKAILCRELTKTFEEVRRSTVSELLTHVAGREIKGEITLIVSGVGEE